MLGATPSTLPTQVLYVLGILTNKTVDFDIGNETMKRRASQLVLEKHLDVSGFLQFLIEYITAKIHIGRGIEFTVTSFRAVDF